MAESWPIPHWDESPSTWDRCVLDGFVLPGVWTVNLDCKRELDVKKSKSKDGARVRDQGYMPSEVLATGKFISPEDWLAWQDAVRLFHPQTFRNGKARGKQRKVLQLEHPNAVLLGVTRVYLVSIQAPTFDNGIAEVAIELLQHVEPQNVPKKLAASEAGIYTLEALQGDPPLRVLAGVEAVF